MAIYPTYSDSQNASEGLHTMFVYANTVTDGLFSMMMLFSIFLIIMFASFFSKQRLTGVGDFPASFAVAAYVTTGVSFILTLEPGLINIGTLVIAVSLSILGTIWLFFSRK